MTFHVHHEKEGTATGVERFARQYEAEMFAAAMRAMPGVTARIVTGCAECGTSHDAEAMPEECEDCARCLGDKWEGNPVCEDCMEKRNEMRECQCPGGEERGPCSCAYCLDSGNRA